MAFNDNNPVVLGVDVGGTKILVGYVDADGVITCQERFPMNRSSQKIALDCLNLAISSFVEKLKVRPLAIGIGLVGHVDYKNGVWLGAMNIPISKPVELAARLSERFGVPVALENDVHAATLAELHLGAGHEYRDFIYMNIGTGLSAGIVCDGRIVRGVGNYAGECGHMVVESDGESCKCGNRGCMETVVSGGGIIELARKLLPGYPQSSLNKLQEENKLFSSTVFHEAEKGDELAKMIAERAEGALRTGLVNLVNLLNPEAVILGGGVVSDGWLMKSIPEYIDMYALPVVKKCIKAVVPSRLKSDHVGLLGAATVAWNHFNHNI